MDRNERIYEATPYRSYSANEVDGIKLVHSLRMGHLIATKLTRAPFKDSPRLTLIYSVNGKEIGTWRNSPYALPYPIWAIVTTPARSS